MCETDIGMDGFSVVKAHPLLVQYIDQLQRKNAEQLSFYPRQVFERESETGRLFLGLLNGEPCGYIYVGAGKTGYVSCHQVCIQYDARRKLYGAALVVAMEDYAKQRGANGVVLRCGFDLEANSFWSELGYSCVNVVDGGIRRMRKINVWQKNLREALFTIESIEPAVGKTNASIWAKHKRTGIVTRFHRSKSLRDYRTLLLSNVDRLPERKT